MTHPDVRRTVEAVWRIESARIVTGLVRLAGDVSLAEDFAQDALLAALEQWEKSGVPENPGAWLSAVARRKAIDGVRRRELASRKQEEVAGELEITGSMAPPDADLGEPIGDEVLRLIFICCHPVLSREARVALTLRLVSGLTTEEVARAFLVPVPTLAQRIVRSRSSGRSGWAEPSVPMRCRRR